MFFLSEIFLNFASYLHPICSLFIRCLLTIDEGIGVFRFVWFPVREIGNFYKVAVWLLDNAVIRLSRFYIFIIIQYYFPSVWPQFQWPNGYRYPFKFVGLKISTQSTSYINKKRIPILFSQEFEKKLKSGSSS